METTTATGKPKSDAVLIKEFFGMRYPGQPLSEYMEESRALTPEDKAQLAKGIRDGSLTY